MSYISVTLLLIVCYTGFSTCAPKANTKLCKSVNKADQCMQKLLLLGDPAFVFPLNKVEMNAHCKYVLTMIKIKNLIKNNNCNNEYYSTFFLFRTITETEKCIKDYSSKCLDTFPRQVTGVLAFGVAKTNKGYCSSQKRKDKFIAIGTCGNAIKAGGDKCMQNYIDTLQGVENVKTADNKFKVPMLWLVSPYYPRFNNAYI